MSLFELKNIPWPVTVNQLYAGKQRRYKSEKYKQFELEIDYWFLQNKRKVDEARKICRPYKFESHKFISLGLDYVVPYETLYTKAGKLKTIDVSNRIKALLDSLSVLLDIDDNRFYLNKVEFVLGNSKYVNIQANEVPIRGINDT